CTDAAAKFVDWENLVPIKVRHLCTQHGIRQLGQCHGSIIHRPDVDHSYDHMISNLVEWLDLVSFVIGCPGSAPRTQSSRRRLYNDVLESVRDIERSGFTVLSGVMSAPQAAIPDWKVRVVSITPKRTDPGALKRQIILVDRRCA